MGEVSHRRLADQLSETVAERGPGHPHPTSPARDAFDNADDYLQAITGLAPIVSGTTTRRVFTDGDDVAVFYDMHTTTPAGTAPIVEWYRVQGDRIAAIRAYFDARPFALPAS